MSFCATATFFKQIAFFLVFKWGTKVRIYREAPTAETNAPLEESFKTTGKLVVYHANS